MLNTIKKLGARLRRDCGGNATILVALGMPALIGGAGLAVDTAQWYMWQRELQYAADQAAIAGAWSKAKNNGGQAYRDRARKELAANKSIVDFNIEATVELADFDGGTDNSVLVSTSATRTLPFSSFLTGAGATIAVSAQATFEEGTTYTSCLVAVDKHKSGAIVIGGNASLNAGCGMAALSDHPEAVKVNGSPTVDIGHILSAGGIDDWFDTNTDDEVHENLSGLTDPFEGLVPPNNTTPRTYACAGKGSNKTAALLPGTYSSIETSCTTSLSPGVYVIDGGNFTIRAQDVVTGSGVIFVLKNGAGLRINGGANINLTGITYQQLIDLGYSDTHASKMENMLVFEDPSSAGNEGNLINGNASTVLNGKVYLPKSNISFKGTAAVTSQCLMIAAATITIDGTADMETFCPPGETNTGEIVATTIDAVKLVA